MAKETPALLRVPVAQPAHFMRNFIRLAVCELRFPTLLELESRPPLLFQKAIRREYPTYDHGADVSLGALSPGGVAQATVHRFSSKNGRWIASMRQASLSLETNAYDSFDDFRKRLMFVVDAARETIDADFFTRVGLRYVNAIEHPITELDGWVNPSLIAPLVEGTFGSALAVQQIQGPTEIGGYIFRHGTSKNPNHGRQEYSLDFDFFSEAVEVAKVPELVEDLHARAYSLFAWALGPKAREFLGPSITIRRTS